VSDWIYGFFMAWGMFLTIPCPKKIWRESARRKMLACLPLIGLIVGGIWALCAWLGSFLPQPLAALLCAAAPWLITGFMHLDGYMDVCDAVLSRRDLEKKLQEKGASETEARYAGEWLEAIGALDDGAYAAALVRHCGDMGYGPQRAREKLREKGVPQELWDEALDELPPDGEQIDRFLQSKLHGRSPEDKEKKRLTDALLRRGFSWGEVRSAWGRYGSEIWEE